MDKDTIVALASGGLPSAIALVRISGTQVKDIARRCLSTGELSHRRATLCNLQYTDGKVVDQVVATLFESPQSYTAEDVLELSLHGGRAVVNSAIDLLLSCTGTRLAEPGEFTRRAVQSGKMDLLEAEAVADLVDAETNAQRAQALQQLGGATSRVFEKWHRDLVDAIALVEVAVDFPDEEDAPDYTPEPVLEILSALLDEIRRAEAGSGRGMQVRDGVSIAIIGAPNAGKSSLLNRLAGRDVAIVTEYAGTTRDIVEVRLNLGGYLARVSDTAGLRASENLVEAEGIRRAAELAGQADLVLGVYDSTGALPDWEQLGVAQPDILVANKTDLEGAQGPDVSRETIALSALTGQGVDRLVSILAELISDRLEVSPDAFVTRRRHLDGLGEARVNLEQAVAGLKSGIGAEIVAEDLRAAARRLERVLGRVDVEDVLGAIFSSFCIGK